MRTLILFFSFLIPVLLFAQTPESLGDVYFEQAEMDKALEQYELALKADPNNPGLWVKTGKTKVEMLDFVKGLADFDKALEIDPNYAPAYYMRSLFQRQVMRNGLLADQDLNKAIELDPNGSYLFMRGMLAYDDGHFEAAAKDFDQALATGEENADLFTYKAALLSDQGQTREALQWAEKAIKLDSLNRLAWAVRMKTLLIMIEPEAVCAVQEEAKAMKVQSEVIDFLEQSTFCSLSKQDQYAELAQIFYLQGDLKTAIKAYSGALAIDPNNYDYLVNRGSASFLMADIENAEKDYVKALGLLDTKDEEERLRLLQGLADMNALDEKYEAAIQYCDQIIAFKPDFTAAILGRGFCNRNLKEYAKAQADFELIMKNEPDNHLPYIYRAWNYFDQGNFEAALTDAGKAVEMKSTDGLGYVILGEAKREFGQDGYCFDYQMAKTLEIPDAAELIEKYCQ